MAQQPESRLQKRIRDAIEKAYPGCFFFKAHGGRYQAAGLPDLIGCICGLYVGIEVKMPGKKPTKLQAETLKRIRKAGGIATWVTSVEAALEWLEPLIEEHAAQLCR